MISLAGSVHSLASLGDGGKHTFSSLRTQGQRSSTFFSSRREIMHSLVDPHFRVDFDGRALVQLIEVQRAS